MIDRLPAQGGFVVAAIGSGALWLLISQVVSLFAS